MKKIVCLMMITMLVLAMGVSAYARYELCPDCEEGLVEGRTVVRLEKIGRCEADPSVFDYWRNTYVQYKCPVCNIVQYEDLIEHEFVCGQDLR